MKRMMIIMMIIFTALLINGCKLPFFKSTQGTSTIIGISTPNNNLKFQILSYLSGQEIILNEKSDIDYQWKIAESNDYFGVIKTDTYKEGKIKVK